MRKIEIKKTEKIIIYVLGETIVKQAFCTKTACKSLDFGELVLQDNFGKNLPLSVFVRLAR